MNWLTDFLLAVVDLFEAEARALRRGVARLVTSATLVVCAGVLVLAAVGLLTWSLYQYLLRYFDPAAAGGIGGVTLIIVAAIMFGVAKWLSR